ncbi:MAG TPA: carbon-nitrogen family hydrolase [Candidatus Nitrosocosmicus sp.]|nr:carbon-nitrogen family hydrolase [Candidatus Nitrosocosmicus sp.]
MDRMKAAVIQLDIAEGKPEANRKRAELLIEKAAAIEPDVILLPEMWTTGYELDKLEQICDREGRPTLDMISRLAEKHGVNIIAGSFADMGKAGGIRNTSYVVDRKGNTIAQYEKIHLFKLMGEHTSLKAGGKYCTFEIDGVRCGLIICYDLRFPELVRTLALEGIQVLFVPAEWPGKRLMHWSTLLKARAIENQIFVVAANRAGKGEGDVFAGGSVVIDPWGEVLAEADFREQIISAGIELGKVKEIRSHMDILGDRVPETYRL